MEAVGAARVAAVVVHRAAISWLANKAAVACIGASSAIDQTSMILATAAAIGPDGPRAAAQPTTHWGPAATTTDTTTVAGMKEAHTTERFRTCTGAKGVRPLDSPPRPSRNRLNLSLRLVAARSMAARHSISTMPRSRLVRRCARHLAPAGCAVKFNRHPDKQTAGNSEQRYRSIQPGSCPRTHAGRRVSWIPGRRA